MRGVRLLVGGACGAETGPGKALDGARRDDGCARCGRFGLPVLSLLLGRPFGVSLRYGDYTAKCSVTNTVAK